MRTKLVNSYKALRKVPSNSKHFNSCTDRLLLEDTWMLTVCIMECPLCE